MPKTARFGRFLSDFCAILNLFLPFFIYVQKTVLRSTYFFDIMKVQKYESELIQVLKPRILVIGDARTEMVVTTDTMPERNGRSEAESVDYFPGGKGVISSVALARLGADAVLCSALGNDTYEKELVDYLESERVDTRYSPQKRGESTPIDIIIKDYNGNEKTIAYNGAIGKFTESDVEEAFISYPDAVILHGALPEKIIDEAVSQTNSHGLPLFLLTLPDPSRYPLSRIGGCEILVTDENGALKYTGIRPSDQEKCMRACIALSQRVKAKHVIIRLGERGTFLFDGKFSTFVSAYDVPQPKGVESDDAFGAALVYEYLRSDCDIARACDFATIVSAVFLTRGGGMRAYPYFEDVRRFVKKNEIDYDVDDL